MRLRTKLVLSATALTSAIVLVLSAIFVGELLRQRIEQTASSNEVLAREVVLISRQAVESGLRDHPPLERTPAAITRAVIAAVHDSGSLDDVMQAVVRYSPTVEDVTITDVRGQTLLSTDPDLVGQMMPPRMDLTMVRDESVLQQLHQVFGVPRVLDLRAPLDRNGQPFLIVHVGVRSTFVRASYEPWLRAALLFAVLSAVGAMVAAGVLATAALQPIEEISRRLEHLAPDAGGDGEAADTSTVPPRRMTGPLRISPSPQDAVLRMTRTIDRLGAKMRSREAGYTALQANVNEMLDALRDGVLLFGPDGRASIISDSANYFLVAAEQSRIGRPIGEIFPAETTLGAVVLDAYASGERSVSELVEMEDGREVQVSLDRIGAASGRTAGVLVRLRDMEYAAQLGRELEVSQRLAAVGRLTAGVGHEVKNPINAMVVHLELLRAKLGALTDRTAAAGAQRHVEILAGEMQRLDRVVQTLADFSRPMELRLTDRNVRDVLEAVMDLTEAQMDANGVRMELIAPAELLPVRMDAELMQQALLNLLLNGMQAMPDGGVVQLRGRRERGEVVIQIADEGEGIPEEVLPRIFDLYFTTKPKGSGIGLAMCYRIVQMHGGSLSVRSATAEQAAATGTKQGTLVELRLPAGMGVEGRRLARAEVHEPRPAGEVH